MSELKPCSCEGEAWLCAGYSGWWSKCFECGAEGPEKATKAEAIEAWNRRANDAEK